MTYQLLLLGLLAGCTISHAAPTSNEADARNVDKDGNDLTSAASTSYVRRYSDLGGYNGYQSGYNNGYGAGVTGHGVIDDRYNSYYGQGQGGYDAGLGYNGYSGYTGGGYGGYGGYKGYSGLSGYGGYGGYGGFGGNGGLNSYYGYNNPYYQGAGNLGYGYHKKSGFYGPVTPSLVTGYRGYSR